MTESSNNPNQGNSGQRSGGNRRRRYRGNRQGGGDNQPRGDRPQMQGNQQRNQGQNRSPESRNRDNQSANRRRPHGRPLTITQILVKYDNLLEQHLITRRKYYEYFNRVDERQLYRLEKNFFDSIEHLRRFEANLEPWQREALEKRKTERYRPDLTYSTNHDLPPGPAPVEVSPEEIEDPHFTESQKEAFEAYKEDTEESVGSYEDYMKLKGLA